MWAYVTIAIGGVFGCWARYAMTTSVQAWLGRDFPYATLSINIAACLLIGFLFTVTMERIVVAPAIRLGILTGFIGGFSTFSTFAMELICWPKEANGAAARFMFFCRCCWGSRQPWQASLQPVQFRGLRYEN